MLWLALAAAVAADAGSDPGPLLALNVMLGDNIDAARGQMRIDKIPFKRADAAEVVHFFERCAAPFEDARPCAVVTDRARVVGLRGSVGPLSEKQARARFGKARAYLERERRARGTKVKAKALERLEWQQTIGAQKLTTALELVKLPRGHEVRFWYALE